MRNFYKMITIMKKIFSSVIILLLIVCGCTGKKQPDLSSGDEYNTSKKLGKAELRKLESHLFH